MDTANREVNDACDLKASNGLEKEHVGSEMNNNPNQIQALLNQRGNSMLSDVRNVAADMQGALNEDGNTKPYKSRIRTLSEGALNEDGNTKPYKSRLRRLSEGALNEDGNTKPYKSRIRTLSEDLENQRKKNSRLETENRKLENKLPIFPSQLDKQASVEQGSKSTLISDRVEASPSTSNNERTGGKTKQKIGLQDDNQTILTQLNFEKRRNEKLEARDQEWEIKVNELKLQLKLEQKKYASLELELRLQIEENMEKSRQEVTQITVKLKEFLVDVSDPKKHEVLVRFGAPKMPTQKRYPTMDIWFNTFHRIPVCVLEHLTKEIMVGDPTPAKGAKLSIRADDDVPGCPFAKDYEGIWMAQLTQGHQAAMGNYGSEPDKICVCVFTNIVPQLAGFNGGAWHFLEKKVRDWASKCSDGVWILSGGFLDYPMKKIGEKKVAVPNSFFKVVLLVHDGVMEKRAFILPHKDIQIPSCKFKEIKASLVKKTPGLSTKTLNAKAKKETKDLGISELKSYQRQVHEVENKLGFNVFPKATPLGKLDSIW